MTKDLLGTAIITFLILTPIVALKTTMNQGVLTISERWWMTFVFVAIVVGVRLFLHLFVWHKAPSANTQTSVSVAATKSSITEAIAKNIAPGLLIFAVVFPIFTFFHPIWDKRVMDLAVYILIYIMLGWGLNVVVGLAGDRKSVV